MEKFKLKGKTYSFDHVGMIIEGEITNNGAGVKADAVTICKNNTDIMSKQDILDCILTSQDAKWYYHKENLELLKRSKITLLEFALLKSYYDKKYRYVARDRNYSLYFYKKRPVKKQEYWAYPEHEGYNYARFIIKPFVNLFNFIEWEDDEPFKIEEILKDFEVVDNE